MAMRLEDNVAQGKSNRMGSWEMPPEAGHCSIALINHFYFALGLLTILFTVSNDHSFSQKRSLSLYTF